MFRKLKSGSFIILYLSQKITSHMNKIMPVAFLCIVFLQTSFSYAEEWHVDKDADNLVKFHSETTLLDFEGETENIDGYVYWEEEKNFGEGELYFEVPLVTFSTGIGKRDRDMREDVLETDKYPYASFSGYFNTLSKKGDTYQVASNGELLLHGLKKKMQVHATVVIEKDKMNVTCTFTFLLKDFSIDAPDLLAFIKVAQEIEITLNFNLKKVS